MRRGMPHAGVGAAEHDHERDGERNGTNVYSAAVREQLGQRRVVGLAQQAPVVPPREQRRHRAPRTSISQARAERLTAEEGDWDHLTLDAA